MENEIYEMSNGQCLIGACIETYFFNEWKKGVDVLNPGYIKSQLFKVYDKYPHASFARTKLFERAEREGGDSLHTGLNLEENAIEYGVSELRFAIGLTIDPDYTREEADAWIS
tara:strand:- start:135 stop:473 length:339 start_codon:yes stop_codon:yes gene_type:complete